MIWETIKQKIKRKHLIYGGAGLGFLLIALWAFRPTSQPVEFAKVEKGPYEQILQEDGTTQVREKFTVLSPYSGQLQRVERHAGEAVKKGEVLATVIWDQPTPIRSPETGFILKVFREDAGPIEIGSPIMEVGNTASLEIAIDVLTADAVNVKAGNMVRIVRWGGPRPLAAKVRVVQPQAFIKISSLGVEERRVRVLADIITPRDEWKGLGDNFRLECQIITFRADSALKIHTGALFREGDGWAVYRVIKGRAKKTPVKIKMRGALEALVESGLTEGEEVVLYPGDLVVEGSRVKEM
jgi:HlyD family secretion protein